MSNETDRAVSALHLLMEKVVALGERLVESMELACQNTFFVQKQFNDAELKAMKAIKEALDPKGILNPGKIFDVFKPWTYKKEKVVLSWERHP